MPGVVMGTAKSRKTVAPQRSNRDAKNARARNAGSSGRPSTERTLLVLSHLAAKGQSLAVNEIAESLRLPKATTSRICAKLRRSGYLVYEPGGRRLAVGPRLFRLGLDVVRQSSASSARHAILAELVDDIGETCNVTTMADACVLYLDRVETRWPLRLALEPGSRVPLHCTASGKLFLSMLTPAACDALLETLPLPAFTPRTATTRQRLARELKRTAARGYSLDDEEFITGLVAVAVPVTDGDGRTIAALACHAPVARLSLRAAVGLVPRLQRAAARIGGLAREGMA